MHIPNNPNNHTEANNSNSSSQLVGAGNQAKLDNLNMPVTDAVDPFAGGSIPSAPHPWASQVSRDRNVGSGKR